MCDTLATANGEDQSEMDLVLNGGKKEMDSATIPIAWFFSDKVIAKKPGYIVFFEQNSSEMSMSWQTSLYGRRYGVELRKKTVDFIQLFRPGRHRIIALAIADGEDGKDLADSYLIQNEGGKYEKSFPIHEIEQGDTHRIHEPSVLAGTIVEFEVPEELFAQKPETKTGELTWWWVNRYYREAPRDQCDYRRRMMLAFTLKPFLGLAELAWEFVFRSFHSAYVFLASMVVLFFGYRPDPIFAETMSAIKGKRYFEHDVRRYRIYRMWEKEKYMPVTGAEISIAAFCLLRVHYAILNFQEVSLATWVVIVYSVFLVALVLAVFFPRIAKHYKLKSKSRFEFGKKLNDLTSGILLRLTTKIQAMDKAGQDKADKKHRLYLASLSIDNKPDAVDLANLPAPPQTSRKVIQKFTVAWWILKGMVCKPYAQ